MLLFKEIFSKRRKDRKVSEVTPPYCSFFSIPGMKGIHGKKGA
jgi:hypothetical protein